MLLRALLHAHRWATALRTGTQLGDLARSAGKDQAVLRKRIRLAFLAPRIQRAMLDGTFPPEHTLCQILPLLIPLDWEAQAHLFGM